MTLLCERTTEPTSVDVDTEFLFELRTSLFEPRRPEATADGERRVFWVASGAFAGPRLRGTVLPGEADWLLTRPDGSSELDARLALRTDDGNLVFMSYRGRLDTPTEAPRLADGEPSDAAADYFRTAPCFTTASERYDWLNRLLAVGVGQHEPDGVHYRVYAIR